MADRQRAEALGIHLAQPAGLEARRHQREIAAGEDLAGLSIVEANLDGNRLRRARLGLEQRLLETRLALTGDDDLAACVDDRLGASMTRSTPF
jgi:hypothetical protein